MRELKSSVFYEAMEGKVKKSEVREFLMNFSNT